MTEVSPEYSLRVWLLREPREEAAAISARALLRAISLTGLIIDPYQSLAGWRSVIVLPLFRAGIIAAAGVVKPTHELRRAANDALLAFDAAANSAYVAREAELEDGHIIKSAIVAAEHAVVAVTENGNMGVVADAITSAAYTARAAKALSNEISDAFWRTVEDEANRLENGESILGLPLWLGGTPSVVEQGWQNLKDALLDKSPYWIELAQWYEDRVVGEAIAVQHERPSSTAMEIEIATLPEDIWSSGKKANDAIAEIHNRYWGKDQTEDVVGIPPPQPAALDPTWVDGVLSLPHKSASADIPEDSLGGALAALRSEIGSLVEDASKVGNIDQRLVEYLRRVATSVPSEAPDQVSLFRLGHAFEVIERAQVTVTKEWPEILGFQYTGMRLAFERTLKQFPTWKQFRQNASDLRLSPEQVALAPAFARELADALRDPDVATIVSPEIAQELEALASGAVEGGWEQELDSATEQLAADLIESSSNVFKGLFGPFFDGFKEGKGKEGLRHTLGKSLGIEANKAAENAGPALTKAIKKLAKIGFLGSLGGVGYHQLSQFSWIDPVWQFLKRHLDL